MKNIYNTILIIHFSFLVLFSQSNWTWLNPLPQGNTLRDIKFTDSNTGYAVGEAGTVIKTTNGGLNWSFCSSNRYGTLSQVNIINQGLIYVGGEHTLWKSSDAGSTWLITSNNLSIVSMFFLNESTGFTGGGNGNVAKTSDGGNSWSTYHTEPSSNISSLYFFDTSNGCLCDYNTIQKTTNGGVNWTIVLQDSSSVWYNSVTFINNNTGFACGTSGRIAKTTNSGSNWFNLHSGVDTTLKSISYLDVNNVISCGVKGIIIKSTDGGSSWFQTYTGDTLDLNVLCSKLNNIVYACGSRGVLMKSADSGNNWVLLSSGVYYNMGGCYFVNSATGYVTCNNNIVMKTTNSGNSWSFQNTGLLVYLNKVFFTDVNTGYGAGHFGRMCKTTNGGNNWDYTSSPISSDFLSIFFVNSLTGYISGESVNHIWFTVDGAQNWALMDIPAQGVISNICFINANTGFITTGNSYIVKTTNAGKGWRVVYYAAGSIGGIDFPDQNTGYCASSPYALKTTDCGENWFALPSLGGGFYIQFADVDHGYMTGFVMGLSTSYASIYRTTNGGINWTIEYPGLRNISCIFVTSPDTCYLTYDNGAILARKPALVNIDPLTNPVPRKFYLSQNYPNPFNSKTKIKFDIPSNGKRETSNVRLIIYDVLGREVATLVNGQLKPGSYEIEWDGSNYPSGVDFYKLTTESYMETKKMVLVK